MKKWIWMAAAALALDACQGQAAGNASETVAQEVVAQSSEADVVNRVQEIYSAVFKEYNREDSLRNLDLLTDQGAYAHLNEFNRNYCSREWNRLVDQINNIDSLYYAGEMGFWEADYWIMGQDWHDLSISDVKVLSLNSNEASVEFLLHNFDAARPVKLQLVNEDGVWKIDDFKDNDLDWKASMKEYVSTETAKNRH